MLKSGADPVTVAGNLDGIFRDNPELRDKYIPKELQQQFDDARVRLTEFTQQAKNLLQTR